MDYCNDVLQRHIKRLLQMCYCKTVYNVCVKNVSYKMYYCTELLNGVYTRFVRVVFVTHIT